MHLHGIKIENRPLFYIVGGIYVKKLGYTLLSISCLQIFTGLTYIILHFFLFFIVGNLLLNIENKISIKTGYSEVMQSEKILEIIYPLLSVIIVIGLLILYIKLIPKILQNFEISFKEFAAICISFFCIVTVISLTCIFKSGAFYSAFVNFYMSIFQQLTAEVKFIATQFLYDTKINISATMVVTIIIENMLKVLALLAGYRWHITKTQGA